MYLALVNSDADVSLRPGCDRLSKAIKQYSAYNENFYSEVFDQEPGFKWK